MQRIYFLTPDLISTKAIAEEMDATNIHSVHVIGRDHAKLERSHLHEAGILQTSNIVPAVKKGACVGVLLGSLITLMLDISIWSAFFMVIFGGFFGAWASSLVGIGIDDPVMKEYKTAVAEGRYLMLIDVPKSRKHEIEQLIKSHHPEANIAYVADAINS